MKRYGEEPTKVGEFRIEPKQMMFYQDMLIKLPGRSESVCYEQRLEYFTPVINAAMKDFVETYGLSAFVNCCIYLSAKYLYQAENVCYNRPGWHCDGFMSGDINYVWCDSCPTIFNTSAFNLSQDDTKSMQEMEEQALPENDVTYPDYTLLRLDQYNVHKVGEIHSPGMRAFVKVTFSKDKYDLEGNAHNYLLDYKWDMKKRALSRNIPQTEKI